MNRILVSVALASMFVVGCGRAALDQEAMAPANAADARAEIAKTPAQKAEVSKEDIGADATPALVSGGAARMPGDFVVYRFTGSFRKTPLTLSEKVIARNGSTITVDLTLTEGDKKDEMRIRINEASATHNDVVSAARIEGGEEKPVTLVDYEALIARTTLSADTNEALVGTEDVTVDVGGSALQAKRTTYRVRVGKKAATLSTLESATFAWGDVGGEIKTANGKLIYRAEVVDSGHDDGASKAASNTP